jgi:hypothetical protein
MPSKELIGRRVRILAWYDHAPLVAAHRWPTAPGDGPEGTVTRLDDATGRVSVLVEGLDRVFILQWGDVVVLPTD